MGESSIEESGTESDRRAQDRAGTSCLEVFEASFGEGANQFSDRLYLLDCSKVGMRVNSTRPLPEQDTILNLRRDEVRLELTVRRAWSEQLLGGYWVTGLELVDPDPKALEALRKAAPAAFEAPARRRSFRIPRLDRVQVGSHSGNAWLPATSLDISPEGMRVVVDRYASEGEHLPLRMSLSKGGELFAMAEVAWVRNISLRELELGLKLIDIGPRTARMFRDYLEAASDRR